MESFMLSALSKTIRQCGDPAFRSVLWRSIGVSALVFVVLWILAWLGLSWTGEWVNQWVDGQELSDFWAGILDWLFGAASVAGVFIVSFLLFPGVVGLAMTFFLDDVALAVEKKHYTGLPPARQQPWREMIVDALSLALTTVAINLIALPLYLLLLFLPPFNLFVFYGINGYLLGREYFEMVAVRRLDSPAAKQLRRRYRGRIFVAGVIIAFLLTIPLINLVAPIVATGLLVHIFEDLRRRSGAGAVQES